MKVLWNGELRDGESLGIPFGDRAFLLGDGLFETVRVSDGAIENWGPHFERLKAGSEFLKIRIPEGVERLSEAVATLLEANQLTDAAARLTVSRGVGARGYSPRGADWPSWLLTVAPLPDRFPESARLLISPYRVFSGDALLRYKTTSRALNVAAKADAEARGADDAIFVNERGELTETTGANLFLYIRETWRTAPVESGLLPGTTRQLVMRRLSQLGDGVEERAVHVDELEEVTSALITSSVVGPLAVSRIEGRPLDPRSIDG